MRSPPSAIEEAQLPLFSSARDSNDSEYAERHFTPCNNLSWIKSVFQPSGLPKMAMFPTERTMIGTHSRVMETDTAIYYTRQSIEGRCSGRTDSLQARTHPNQWVDGDVH
jgi:hypothetical protein